MSNFPPPTPNDELIGWLDSDTLAMLIGGAQAFDSPAVLDDLFDLDHGRVLWPDAG